MRTTAGARGLLEPEILTEEPFNAETPWRALLLPRTPSSTFFVRNHFGEPDLPPETYELRVGEGGTRPRTLRLTELERLAQYRLACVTECAGNGRSHMVPRPPGVPWGDGAVGCADWEGPALQDVLALAPPREGTVEVVFRGADSGIEGGSAVHFERALPLDLAVNGPAIIALRMNGALLPHRHGGPARLVVPGWYGVASVKWLVDVRYLDHPFIGPFQTQQYVWDDGSPLREVRPRGVLLHPAAGELLTAGSVLLEGRAWAGGGISAVDVRIDDGPWSAASLGSAEGWWEWVRWHLRVTLAEGIRRVSVRARDATGQEQPLDPVTGRLGYGYNTVIPIDLRIGPAR